MCIRRRKKETQGREISLEGYITWTGAWVIQHIMEVELVWFGSAGWYPINFLNAINHHSEYVAQHAPNIITEWIKDCFKFPSNPFLAYIVSTAFGCVCVPITCSLIQAQKHVLNQLLCLERSLFNVHMYYSGAKCPQAHSGKGWYPMQEGGGKEKLDQWKARGMWASTIWSTVKASIHMAVTSVMNCYIALPERKIEDALGRKP